MIIEGDCIDVVYGYEAMRIRIVGRRLAPAAPFDAAQVRRDTQVPPHTKQRIDGR
jgi:hypothetical protein